MKFKFFFLFVLLMGIGAFTFGQAASDDATVKQETTKKEVTLQTDKSSDCKGHQATSKADCKWVDADKDGVCDICGSKECGKESHATTKKGCDPAACGSKAHAKSSCDHSKKEKKEDDN